MTTIDIISTVLAASIMSSLVLVVVYGVLRDCFVGRKVRRAEADAKLFADPIFRESMNELNEYLRDCRDGLAPEPPYTGGDEWRA